MTDAMYVKRFFLFVKLIMDNLLHGRIAVTCEECSSTVTVKQRSLKGNPSNHPFIFHEDDFNPFSDEIGLLLP